MAGTEELKEMLKEFGGPIYTEKKDIELNKALDKKITDRKKQFYDRNKQTVVAKK